MKCAQAVRKKIPLRLTGLLLKNDAVLVSEDGYLYIMACTRDIINLAGLRLSIGAMDEVLENHGDVAECAF